MGDVFLLGKKVPVPARLLLSFLKATPVVVVTMPLILLPHFFASRSQGGFALSNAPSMPNGYSVSVPHSRDVDSLSSFHGPNIPSLPGQLPMSRSRPMARKSHAHRVQPPQGGGGNRNAHRWFTIHRPIFVRTNSPGLQNLTSLKKSELFFLAKFYLQFLSTSNNSFCGGGYNTGW